MRKLLLAGAAGLLSITSANALPTSFSTDGLTFSDITCTTKASGNTFGDCGSLGASSAPAATASSSPVCWPRSVPRVHAWT